jgi:hypothetical protein
MNTNYESLRIYECYQYAFAHNDSKTNNLKFEKGIIANFRNINIRKFVIIRF